MTFKNWFKPFEALQGNQRLIIIACWVVLVLAWWFIGTSGEKSLLPPPGKVMEGMKSLWNEGLVSHIVSSLGLCLQATLISIVISLAIAYLSPVPFIKPVGQFPEPVALPAADGHHFLLGHDSVRCPYHAGLGAGGVHEPILHHLATGRHP
ncbi:MAG: hypothetical protein IPN76_08960 [Saprospiraceae bacterium]|nr:hypothetical protein [Saprospiraceae bacterium]